jgi:hypothetical protein
MKPINKMTDAEIIRELAEDAMGYSEVPSPTGHATLYNDGSGDKDKDYFLWNPSTNANDMLMLVNAMENKGFIFAIHTWSSTDKPNGKTVDIWCPSVSSKPTRGYGPDFKRTICLAALKALRAMKENTNE